jgi:hypothetical protein
MQERHVPQTCPHCEERLPAGSLPLHEEDCPQLPTYCEYCELEVPRAGFAQHQDRCSARNRQCHKCQAYVTLRAFPTHVCQPRQEAASDPRPPPSRVPPEEPPRGRVPPEEPHAPLGWLGEAHSRPGMEDMGAGLHRIRRNAPAIRDIGLEMERGIVRANTMIEQDPQEAVKKNRVARDWRSLDTAPFLTLRPSYYHSIIRPSNQTHEFEFMPVGYP